MRIVMFAALLLAGCNSSVTTGPNGTGPLQAGFENALVSEDGCGDLSLYAGTLDKGIGIAFTGTGFAKMAYDTGGELAVELALPSDAKLEVHLGDNITEGYCVDVPLPDGALQHRYAATEGKALLTVVPTPDSNLPGQYAAEATVVLENVSLSLQDDELEHRLDMGTVTISSQVGWLAG